MEKEFIEKIYEENKNVDSQDSDDAIDHLIDRLINDELEIEQDKAIQLIIEWVNKNYYYE